MLYQFDLVSVRIFDERDKLTWIALQGAWCPGYPDTRMLKKTNRFVDVWHANGEVPKCCAEAVPIGTPVVCQLNHRRVRFFAITHESQGELAFDEVLAPQQAHAEMANIEGQRVLELLHTQHGVEQAWGYG